MARTEILSPLPKSATELFGNPTENSNPLWLAPSKFSDREFDPESYVTDLRTFVPFDTLRSELRSLLADLENELIYLINRDYADFVSLSTELVDVNASVVRMRAPLLEIKEKILSFRGSLDESLTELHSLIKKRAKTSEARDVLELMHNAFNVLSKVEKLMKELPCASEGTQRRNGISFQHVENGTSLRETQTMLVERIANEIHRLNFFTTHEQAQHIPFMKNMLKRTQSASELLYDILSRCFVDGLEHRDKNTIYHCLRAYAATESIYMAEDIFRSKCVEPFILKVIPYGSSNMVENDLQQDYERIKKHIEDDCKFVLDIASAENSGLHVFNFLANSILKEVLYAIVRRKPLAISPGRPKEFLKNYKSSLDFVAYLEGYCSSRAAVAKFRAEVVYVEFMKHWNTGVYFSLRFQEIAGALDSALTNTISVPSRNSSRQEHSRSLVLNQSISLMDCLRSCWKDDVFIHSSSDKFLRLVLQLISRYSCWLSGVLHACKTGNMTPDSGSKPDVTDDFLYIINDLGVLVEEVSGDYLDHVLQVLRPCPTEVLDSVKQSVLQSVSALKDLQPLVVNLILETLVEMSVKDLQQLKGIASTYTMTNKPTPTRHSQYVSGLLDPLKAFLEGAGAAYYLSSDIKTGLVHATAYEITHRYNELAAELVSVARARTASLQRFRAGVQMRGGGNADVSDGDVSETEKKFCMHLFLDIQEYGRNLGSLGVDAAEIPAYRSLWQCVSPPEKQNTISF